MGSCTILFDKALQDRPIAHLYLAAQTSYENQGQNQSVQLHANERLAYLVVLYQRVLFNFPYVGSLYYNEL